MSTTPITITEAQLKALQVEYEARVHPTPEVKPEVSMSALKGALNAIGITVKREWKDGDVLVFDSYEGHTPAYYVRRNGAWHALPAAVGWATGRVSDAVIDTRYALGQVKEVEWFEHH